MTKIKNVVMCATKIESGVINFILLIKIFTTAKTYFYFFTMFGMFFNLKIHLHINLRPLVLRKLHKQWACYTETETVTHDNYYSLQHLLFAWLDIIKKVLKKESAMTSATIIGKTKNENILKRVKLKGSE